MATTKKPARIRKPADTPRSAALPFPGVANGAETAGTAVPVAAAEYRREAESALLEHYAPPALIVDGKFRILHFQGDLSAYLSRPTDQPGFLLLKMVRRELVVDLRAALTEARESNAPVHRDPISFEHRGKTVAVRLEVRPLTSQAARKDFLVVFQKTDTPAVIAPQKQAAGKLTREVASLLAQPAALIAKHETARKKMQSGNEEILSGNEELQSTSEELTMLNDELGQRNAELSVLSRDLNNLLRAST